MENEVRLKLIDLLDSNTISESFDTAEAAMYSETQNNKPLADQIISLLKPEWISVKDKLPNEYEPVLVMIDVSETYYRDYDYMQTAKWVNVGTDEEPMIIWKCIDSGIDNVTHWMPLPATPTV